MQSQAVSVYTLEEDIRVICYDAKGLFQLYNGDESSITSIKHLIGQLGVCITSGPISRDVAFHLDQSSDFIEELQGFLNEGRTIFLLKDILAGMSKDEKCAILSHELGHFFVPTYKSDTFFDVERRADDFSIRRYGVYPLLRGLKRLKTNYELLCETFQVTPYLDMVSELVLDRRIHHLSNLAYRA